MAKDNTTMRETTSDIIIHKIEIRKPTGEIFPVTPIEPDKDGMTEKIFISLSISEGISTPGVSGQLKIRESQSGSGLGGDYFNFIGNEFIYIDIESPDIEDSRKQLTFCINDMKTLGNEASDSLGGPAGRADAGWLLQFMSCETYYLNWAENPIAQDEDYIGHIASEESFDGEPGLVNQLAEKLFNPEATEFSFSKNKMEIEPTHNTAWIKKHHNMYPWAKDTHHSNLMELMLDLTENAVSEVDSQKGANYLFYADIDGWHFKSARKILNDESGSYFFGFFGKDPREYMITDTDIDITEWNFGDPRIKHLAILNEYNHLSLWENGAYSAYYELVKPNYDDPYFDYLDFTTTHQKSNAEVWGEREIITYSYNDDPWGSDEDGGRIEKFRLLPDSIDTSIEVSDGEVKTKARRLYDDNGLFGYFSPSYNSPKQSNTDILGSSSTQGKTGKQNTVLWQTMFDQTDLEGEILYKIQKKIKKPLRESGNLQEYSDIKNAKEKWEVYRRSICCDASSVEKFQFLAVIEDAKNIQDDKRGGIYEYSWKEVEIWPKDSMSEGATAGSEILTVDDAPVQIATVVDGLSGTFREDDNDEWTNPAFNINELFNITEGDDVFVGPGINVADDDFNDYPEAYQMMPVGGYFKVGEDPCEIDHEDTEVYFHKHVVQMYRVPSYVINSIMVDEDEDDDSLPEEIYFFDVPNVHDGLCSCL